jgi:hypothetical protein
VVPLEGRLPREGDSRALGHDHGSIRGLLATRGGIAPSVRSRGNLALTRIEREDISRGIACGAKDAQKEQNCECTVAVAAMRQRRFYRVMCVAGRAKSGNSAPGNDC